MLHWHGNTIAYKGSAAWLVSDLMKCSASMKASLSQLNMFCFREKAKDKLIISLYFNTITMIQQISII